MVALPTHRRGTTPVLVVLPALNEQASVAAVVAEVSHAWPSAEVLVVDDGSTDATAAVAAAAGARVLSLPFNLGVGGAMRAAFRYAVREGFDTVVQVDADGQHDPAEIGALLEAAEAGADVVVGARFAGKGVYAARGPRRWAMRLLAAVLSRMSGTRLTDPTSGFRLTGPRALPVFAEHYPEEYLGDTVESLVIAHRVGLRIAQVPVAMRPRAGGVASQSPYRAAVFLCRVVAAVALATVRERPRVSGGVPVGTVG
ncbi:glycosyltransferase family 2 protein [Rhodococcus aerolatus]